MPGIKLYSSTEPQKTCSWLLRGCQKDRYKARNSLGNTGIGTIVVTCGVSWEVITSQQKVLYVSISQPKELD